MHTCNLTFGSFGYEDFEFIYKWTDDKIFIETEGSIKKAFDIDSARQSFEVKNEFKLYNISYAEQTLVTINGRRSMLVVCFHVKRQLGYFIIQTYLPCILLVITSQISFWINKENTPGRIIFGSNSVLSLLLLNNSVRDDVPKVTYVTALDIYMTVCFVFTFLALAQYAFVNHLTVTKPRKILESSDEQIMKMKVFKEKLYHLEKRENRFSRKLQRMHSAALRLDYKCYEDMKADEHKTNVENAKRMINDKALRAMTGDSIVDQLSRVLFPVAFFISTNQKNTIII